MTVKSDIKRRINELRKLISKYDSHYYVLNKPLIDDYEYDLLYKELVLLEKQNPEFDSSLSPTKRVSEKNITGFKKFKHIPKMYSLENTYSDDELSAFHKRIKDVLKNNFSYSVEPKIDGAALSVIYRDSVFYKALTRGDGESGDDVTDNIKTIRELPLSLNKIIKGELIIRGEVFFTKKRFEKLSETYSFSNPRNSAAGTLKLLSPKEVSKRMLSILFHTVVTPIATTHIETLLELKTLGLPVVNQIAAAKTLEELIEIKNMFEIKRFSLPYETDGIVVKVNQLPLREKVGFTSKSPRWAFAYKYAPKKAITRLQSISFQVGRTGVITPVANLTPVELSGTVVKRATLHNFEEIDRLEIKKLDFVEIEKSGEIIPKVVRVIKEKRSGKEISIERPFLCPSCKEKLVKYDDEVAIRCINKNCPEQIELSLIHFASKKAMNINNMGPSIISKFIEKKLVKSISDIYSLTKENLLSIDRIKEKSATNLLMAIERSKKNTLSKFIYGLGIRNIGEYASSILADKFRTLDLFILAGYDELIKVPSIGDESAKAILLFFSNEGNIREIRKLMNMGLVLEISENRDVLNGLSFVITGTLKNMSREEAKKFIIENGGTVQSDVSNNTNYLVVGENPGSKIIRANELSVKMINIDELKDMVQ